MNETHASMNHFYILNMTGFKKVWFFTMILFGFDNIVKLHTLWYQINAYECEAKILGFGV